MPERPALFFDAHMPGAESLPVAGGEVVVFSSRSPFRDGPNQDAAGVVPLSDRRAVLVVADGMGGGPSGDEASRTAVEAVAEAVAAGGDDEADIRAAIVTGIESANETISGRGNGSATTIAVALLDDGRVRPCHVGDSAVLLVGQRGKVKLHTTCHSPVGFAEAAGLIDPDDAMHHADRHLVSNIVGSAEMTIEVGAPVAMAARDTLLLGSDGLFDNLTVDEVVEGIRKGKLRRAADELAVRAADRMTDPGAGTPCKPDDLTFILFRTS